MVGSRGGSAALVGHAFIIFSSGGPTHRSAYTSPAPPLDIVLALQTEHHAFCKLWSRLHYLLGVSTSCIVGTTGSSTLAPTMLAGMLLALGSSVDGTTSSENRCDSILLGFKMRRHTTTISRRQCGKIGHQPFDVLPPPTIVTN